MARILIIDDSPTEQHVARKILEGAGHQVETADSGERGLEIAVSRPPDLILMDVVMPGLNGFQATRKLSQQAETSKVPVVIYSTKDQAVDKAWGIRQGARDYLVKPASKKELLAMVERILG